jgi:hypothetical protein
MCTGPRSQRSHYGRHPTFDYPKACMTPRERLVECIPRERLPVVECTPRERQVECTPRERRVERTPRERQVEFTPRERLVECIPQELLVEDTPLEQLVEETLWLFLHVDHHMHLPSVLLSGWTSISAATVGREDIMSLSAHIGVVPHVTYGTQANLHSTPTLLYL